MSQSPAAPRRSAIDVFLNVVERGGNALPHPATLFALLALIVVVMSGIAAWLEISAQHPATGETINVVNLFSLDGLHRMSTGMVKNFTEFAPLGTVLVALLGIGVAEHSGLIGATLRLLVLSAPRFLLTPVMVFAGVMSNMASEIGYVLLVPLAGLIFLAAGRHPILGMAAAFAGVSGGYSANLLIGTIDPLLAGLSQQAARIVDPDYTVNELANWYFMMASTPIVTILGWFVTEKIVAPRFPRGEESPTPLREKLRWTCFLVEVLAIPTIVWFVLIRGSEGFMPWVYGIVLALALIIIAVYLTQRGFGPADKVDLGGTDEIKPMSSEELRGLKAALWATLAIVVVLAWSLLPHGLAPGAGFMRIEGEPDFLKSIAPLLASVVAVIFTIGIVLGLSYGIAAGTIKSDNDVIKGMGQSMSTLGVYLVLTFFAAQFVAYFNWTQLGLVFAVEGAGVLDSMRQLVLGEGEPAPWRWVLAKIIIMAGFILLTAVANLFMGSASAKWALMAPIFIPMFMILGYSPELTQIAYRIGDSVTNIISPMMSYFALIIAFLQRYEPKAGIGTVISVMLPYSVVFAIGWSLLFVVWLALGLPIGPGAPLQYIPATPAG
ncbi:AbgT family transporter [uncultured Aquimonas sp.]|uniref:AbgT family transporter n=1 Tax=uncultured Aquimonas sp. TaxID=385483 RepID=UPI00086D38C4|nr:AbgT family transporter [uncultured Aquimonas sp.]ODU45359.1 MAG: hypothetical protein ABS96_15005 [Xanthomonadaceae bacterium SCN 69-123]